MKRIIFPTMLRKMWSGTEVQEWLDAHNQERPQSNSGFSFEMLREANKLRLPQFKNAHGKLAHAKEDGSDWTPSDWLQALVGELGEYANFAKKYKRGDVTKTEFALKGGKELADVMIYLDILARRCLDHDEHGADKHGIDLGIATKLKFNEVSVRVNSTVFFTEEGVNIALRKPDDPFRAGDIVRCSAGTTGIARLLSPHASGWHGRQCMGGITFFGKESIRHANAEDLQNVGRKLKLEGIMSDNNEEHFPELDPKDLRISTFNTNRSAGGFVIPNDWGACVYHIPTGLEAKCEKYRGQHKNSAEAYKQLKRKVHLLNVSYPQSLVKSQTVCTDMSAAATWNRALDVAIAIVSDADTPDGCSTDGIVQAIDAQKMPEQGATAVQSGELPEITDDDLSMLHYNPNTSDVVEHMQNYARKAIAAQTAPLDKFIAEHGHKLATALGIDSYDIADRDAQIKARMDGAQTAQAAPSNSDYSRVLVKMYEARADFNQLVELIGFDPKRVRATDGSVDWSLIKDAIATRDAAPPTQAIAVETVQKPKIGERWLVKIKGSQTCHELLVCDLTKKTISLREEKPLIYSPIMRYVIAEVELIEIAAPSQGAKQ